MEHSSSIAGEGHATLRSYGTGFVLALILTIIPFGLVMTGALPLEATLIGVFAAGVVQIVVHLHYFLHLDRSSEQRWNLMSILFAFMIMAIFVGGSVWIMTNLHYRMML